MNRGYGQQRQMVRQRQKVDIDPVAIRKMLIPDITPFRIGLFLTWALGIFMMNNASAPYTPPPEDLARYDELQAQADTMRTAIEAEREFHRAYSEMYRAKGFFYNDPTYPSKLRVYENAKVVYERENTKRQQLRWEANKVVGIWSQFGLDAARASFWDAYERGKQFAKSMTWWDVLFSVGRGSRDEHIIITMLQWVLRIAMNFTIGFIYSLVSFLFGLFYIIADFSPDPASACTFYILGAIAATSIVVSVIVAMYGTIATVVVGGAYMAAQNEQLEGGARRREHLE